MKISKTVTTEFTLTDGSLLRPNLDEVCKFLTSLKSLGIDGVVTRDGSKVTVIETTYFDESNIRKMSR